jgi:IS30 family transposase
MDGLLWEKLRSQKKRKKRYGMISRRCIEERPALVESRRRIWDWESDTIIGKNHCQVIVSIVERKSGLTLIRKFERQTALEVGEAMTDLLKPYQSKVHTMTSDNGREFARH